MPLPYLCNIKSNEMYNLKNKIIMKASTWNATYNTTTHMMKKDVYPPRKS